MNTSIIIPAFTDQATLDRTLGMLEPQMEHAHECIVVDDGSDPPLSSRWARLERIERAPVHRSASFARNRGSRVATGDYFLMCDASIHIMPDAVASITRAMRWLDVVDDIDIMLTAQFVGLKEGEIPDDAHTRMDEWICEARAKGMLPEESVHACEDGGYNMNVDHQFAIVSSGLFYKMGGYDEKHFVHWGLECQDLTLRIIQSGGWVYSGVPRITDGGRRLLVFHEYHDADRDPERKNQEFAAKWGETFTYDLIRRTINESKDRRPQ